MENIENISLNSIINNLLSTTDYYMRAITFNIDLFQDILIKTDRKSIYYKEYGIIEIYFKTINNYTIYCDLRFVNQCLEIPNEVTVCVKRKGPTSFLKENNNIIYCDNIMKINFKTNLYDISLRPFIRHDLYFKNNLECFSDFIKSKIKFIGSSIQVYDDTTFDTINKVDRKENINKLKKLLLKSILYSMETLSHVNFVLYLIMDGSGYEKESEYIKLLEDINFYLIKSLGRRIYDCNGYFNIIVSLESRTVIGDIRKCNFLSFSTLIDKIHMNWLWNVV